MRWYRKAADQGQTMAQFNLALSYELGEGVKRNMRVAISWYPRQLSWATQRRNSVWATATEKARA